MCRSLLTGWLLITALKLSAVVTSNHFIGPCIESCQTSIIVLSWRSVDDVTSASGSVTLLHSVRSCEYSITLSYPPGLSLSYVGVNFKRTLIRFRFSYGNADARPSHLVR